MGFIGVSIVKRTAFRLSTQEFSNSYHYKSADPNPNNAVAGAIIDEIVATERALHSTLVTFVIGRLWSWGGSQAANQMILERPLSGTGTQPTSTGFDPERAVLARWPAGVDNRGRPVYLRKWYHPVGVCNGVAFGAIQTSQQAEISSADRTTIANKVAENGVVGAASSWNLAAPSGRDFDANQVTVHQFLEHHQFGDMWRG